MTKAKLGVDAAEPRSPGSRSSGTSPAMQAGPSMIEWKYTKGLWRMAYWSPCRALWVLSGEPTAGWRQVVPMSSM